MVIHKDGAALVPRFQLLVLSRDSVRKSEDIGIAPGQWDALNRNFYGRPAGPHRYIAARLSVLDGMEDDSKVIESVNLLHHAAEALVRQYLAHRRAPDCPWLELSRMRDFADFKRSLVKIRAESYEDGPKDQLVAVFCGPTTGRTSAAGAAIALAGEGLAALMIYSVELLLNEAGMYNAVKHGIAAIPGKRAIPDEALAPGLGIVLRGGGESLLTLEPVGDGEDRHWTQLVRYVDVAENSAITGLIVEQLANLWSVARARYLAEPLGHLHPMTEDMAHRARYAAGLDAPPTVLEFGFSLRYERAQDLG